MASFSNYYADEIIDHMLRNQAFTPPTTVYAALFTAVTGLETNNPTAEVSGGAYARQSVTINAPTDGVTSNGADVVFPTATANWGTVTHAALVDHVSNNTWGTNVNVLMWQALDDNRTVNTDDVFKFLTGDLDITVD
jgi:hypothetical protein